MRALRLPESGGRGCESALPGGELEVFLTRGSEDVFAFYALNLIAMNHQIFLGILSQSTPR